MTRARLPNRRLQIVETMELGGRRHEVGFGHELGGPIKEIFAQGHLHGSHQAMQLDNDCILVSRLLQHGNSVAELAAAMPSDTSMRAILLRAAEIDAERKG